MSPGVASKINVIQLSSTSDPIRSFCFLFFLEDDRLVTKTICIRKPSARELREGARAQQTEGRRFGSGPWSRMLDMQCVGRLHILNMTATVKVQLPVDECINLLNLLIGFNLNSPQLLNPFECHSFERASFLPRKTVTSTPSLLRSALLAR